MRGGNNRFILYSDKDDSEGTSGESMTAGLWVWSSVVWDNRPFSTRGRVLSWNELSIEKNGSCSPGHSFGRRADRGWGPGWARSSPRCVLLSSCCMPIYGHGIEISVRLQICRHLEVWCQLHSLVPQQVPKPSYLTVCYCTGLRQEERVLTRRPTVVLEGRGSTG